MNMNLLSLNGMVIKTIKNFVLRCHACYELTFYFIFRITTKMNKQFCPRCGGATLMKTSATINENGEIRCFLKNNFQYKLKGTKVYNLF